jgi:predicted cobalt transporter CbtA
MLDRIDMTRPRSIVGWAIVFGLLAGVVAAVYFYIAAEPVIDDAIAIEEAEAAAAGDHHDHEQVSRTTQRGAGLFLGYGLIGAVFGLLLAVTALSLRGSWLDPFRRVVLAGAMLAAAFTVVPWLKYGPNPPGVGDPATAGARQLRYWVLVALTGVALAGVAHLSGRLRRAGWPDARRIAAVAAAVLAVLGIVLAAMPPVHEAIEVPANLIWRFRIASLGGNLLMWGLLTLGFALACTEAQARQAQNSIPLRAETPSS